MGIIDNTIERISPRWAASRARSRMLIQAYEAADKTRLRKRKADHRSGDAAIKTAGRDIRGQARFYEENYDVVGSVFDTLETTVIGANGIRVEPMPLTLDGEVHEEFAAEMAYWFGEWSLKPETTGEHTRPEMERLLCRSWMRDGEVFEKFHIGNIPNFKHHSPIKFSIECLEADFLPDDHSELNNKITQGVERNDWGQATRFHFYRFHPGDVNGVFNNPIIPVKAERVRHLKLSKRLRQARGVSLLHNVLTRIEDIKEYEESERVAARVAAALTAYVKKGDAASYEASNTDEDGNRLMNIAPGMFLDNLAPGEDIGTIASNRPSALLQPFLSSMTKRLAAGTRTNFSSVAREYAGNYSSQRQELVEGYAHYQVFQNQFIGTISRPNYRQFVTMLILSGLVKVPPDIDPKTISLAAYIAPVMPWIDPDKESKANERDIKAGFNTESNVIRSKGYNPQEIKKQRVKEIKFNRDNDLVFSSDAAHETNTTPNNTEITKEENNDAEE